MGVTRTIFMGVRKPLDGSVIGRNDIPVLLKKADRVGNIDFEIMDYIDGVGDYLSDRDKVVQVPDEKTPGEE